MINRTDNRKNKMLEALEKCHGIVSDAVKLVGISRITHYEWIKKDAEYSKAVEDIDNTVLDFVESKLFDQINKGNTACLIFFLKTKGKKRGYVESIEINQSEQTQKIDEYIRTVKKKGYTTNA